MTCIAFVRSRPWLCNSLSSVFPKDGGWRWDLDFEEVGNKLADENTEQEAMQLHV